MNHGQGPLAVAGHPGAAGLAQHGHRSRFGRHRKAGKLPRPTALRLESPGHFPWLPPTRLGYRSLTGAGLRHRRGTASDRRTCGPPCRGADVQPRGACRSLLVLPKAPSGVPDREPLFSPGARAVGAPRRARDFGERSKPSGEVGGRNSLFRRLGAARAQAPWQEDPGQRPAALPRRGAATRLLAPRSGSPEADKLPFAGGGGKATAPRVAPSPHRVSRRSGRTVF